MTHVDLKSANPTSARTGRGRSPFPGAGAFSPFVSREVLDRRGVRRTNTGTFLRLPLDGTETFRRGGAAWSRLRAGEVASMAFLGEPADSSLLGGVTLAERGHLLNSGPGDWR